MVLSLSLAEDLRLCSTLHVLRVLLCVLLYVISTVLHVHTKSETAWKRWRFVCFLVIPRLRLFYLKYFSRPEEKLIK